MAGRYQHRIGVRAEICFDLTVDVRNPTPQELSQLVSQALKQEADNDGGFQSERTSRWDRLSRLEQRGS
jgi:hypothetical protein